MLDIEIIASGSSGNAYLLTSGDSKLLIECGITFSELKKKVKFSELDGVIISHEHKDHCKCIKDLLRMGVFAMMSRGTMEVLHIDSSFVIECRSEKQTNIGPWKILPFAVEHDASEPLGFLIMSPSGDKILYATDTYFIRYKFSGITHFMIEANFSEEFLAENKYLGEDIKDRIRRSHFEIKNVLEFLLSCDISKTREIYLLHLSSQNADREQFIKIIQEATGKPVY